MFINQFAEHDGAGAVIKSPPLRFSKGLDTGGIVPVCEHNIDDVRVLLLTLTQSFQKVSACLLGTPRHVECTKGRRIELTTGR